MNTPIFKKTFLILISGMLASGILLWSSVSFADAPNFTDVVGHKYESAIQFIAESGIVQGYDDKTFRPDLPVLRAELMKIVMKGQYPDAPHKTCFPDVTEDLWYSPYTCKALELGIIQGFPDGKFHGAENVNMVEATKILLGAYDVPYKELEGDFWFAGIIKEAAKKKLIPGDADNFGMNLTRGQIVEMLTRLIKSQNNEVDTYLRETEHDTLDFETLFSGINLEEIYGEPIETLLAVESVQEDEGGDASPEEGSPNDLTEKEDPEPEAEESETLDSEPEEPVTLPFSQQVQNEKGEQMISNGDITITLKVSPEEVDTLPFFETFLVKITIEDNGEQPSPVESATLQVSGPKINEEFELKDDGKGLDWHANDGIYRLEIPHDGIYVPGAYNMTASFNFKDGLFGQLTKEVKPHASLPDLSDEQYLGNMKGVVKIAMVEFVKGDDMQRNLSLICNENNCDQVAPGETCYKAGCYFDIPEGLPENYPLPSEQKTFFEILNGPSPFIKNMGVEHVTPFAGPTFQWIETFYEQQAAARGVNLDLQIDFYGPVNVAGVPVFTDGEKITTVNDLELLEDFFAQGLHESLPNRFDYDVVNVMYFSTDPIAFRAHSSKNRVTYSAFNLDFGVLNYASTVIAHEIAHQFGAKDTYDTVKDDGTCRFPDGYANPTQNPLYPQVQACLMCQVRHLSEEEIQYADYTEIVMCDNQAELIGW